MQKCVRSALRPREYARFVEGLIIVAPLKGITFAEGASPHVGVRSNVFYRLSYCAACPHVADLFRIAHFIVLPSRRPITCLRLFVSFYTIICLQGGMVGNA